MNEGSLPPPSSATTPTQAMKRCILPRVNPCAFGRMVDGGVVIVLVVVLQKSPRKSIISLGHNRWWKSHTRPSWNEEPAEYRGGDQAEALSVEVCSIEIHPCHRQFIRAPGLFSTVRCATVTMALTASEWEKDSSIPGRTNEKAIKEQ